jgi:SAM-dependent methyltransferase
MTSPSSAIPPRTPDKSPGQVPEIFDRHLVRARRARAARAYGDFDFLLKRCEEELADRLSGYHAAYKAQHSGKSPADGFDKVLCLGEHKGSAQRILSGIPGLVPSLVVTCDLAAPMLESKTAHKIVGSDELLPFAPASFDVILAPLTLQFANDLPGALAQIRHCLRPGGLFLCAVFGGETLHELRAAFTSAEIEVDGGLSPRVIPFADIKDFGGLLQRVGFSQAVCDTDKVSVSYATVRRLMRDLRGMGLANPMVLRRKAFLKRSTLAALESAYADQFGFEGEIEASFHIIFGTGHIPEA